VSAVSRAKLDLAWLSIGVRDAKRQFMTTIIIIILIAWFIISALSQLNVRRIVALKSHDVFSLIPNWSFFAPRPGTSDYHLLFRDVNSRGEPGKWQEIPLAERRSLWGAIWNPQKRRTKTLSDVVRGLLRLAQDKSLRDYSFTLPYLAILNYISSLPHPELSVQTQFMILKSDGFFSKQDPEFLFLSNLHGL
jgi:hypothetical protein